MSKQDKDRTETGELTDLTAESAITDSHAMQPQAVSAAEPEQEMVQSEQSQSEQSRLFNSWLDRTLPRLMQYLGASPSSAVTSPSPKAKH